MEVDSLSARSRCEARTKASESEAPSNGRVLRAGRRASSAPGGRDYATLKWTRANKSVAAYRIEDRCHFCRVGCHEGGRKIGAIAESTVDVRPGERVLSHW